MPEKSTKSGDSLEDINRKQADLEVESRELEHRASEIKREREETVRALEVVEVGAQRLRALEEEEAALKARQAEIDSKKREITAEIRKTLALRKKSEHWGPVSSQILEQDIVHLEAEVKELVSAEKEVLFLLEECYRRMDKDSEAPSAEKCARSQDVYITPTDERYLVWLRDVLSKKFTMEELRTLCFDLDKQPGLDVDYEDLEGVGKSAKARALVDYLLNRGAITVLIEVGKQQRPDISW